MQLCEYGCGQESKHQLKNGKWCCSKSYNSCPVARRKNRESNKGKKVSRETIEKIRKTRDGYKHSYQTKLKISKGNKGKTKGRPKSIEHKTKISNALKKFKNTEEAKKIQSLVSTKLWKDLLYKQKVILENKKTKSKESWRMGQSKRSKEMWKNEEYRIKVYNGMKGSFKNSPNKCEKVIENILYNLFPEKYKFVGDCSLWINGKNPDFINKEKNKIIEFFGSYWHGEDMVNMNRIDHEKYRKSFFESSGYKVLIIWEEELKNISKLKRKIMRFDNA